MDQAPIAVTLLKHQADAGELAKLTLWNWDVIQPAQGSAPGCEAGLRPAGLIIKRTGCAPGSGFALTQPSASLPLNQISIHQQRLILELTPMPQTKTGPTIIRRLFN